MEWYNGLFTSNADKMLCTALLFVIVVLAVVLAVCAVVNAKKGKAEEAKIAEAKAKEERLAQAKKEAEAAAQTEEEPVEEEAAEEEPVEEEAAEEEATEEEPVEEEAVEEEAAEEEPVEEEAVEEEAAEEEPVEEEVAEEEAAEEEPVEEETTEEDDEFAQFVDSMDDGEEPVEEEAVEEEAVEEEAAEEEPVEEEVAEEETAEEEPVVAAEKPAKKGRSYNGKYEVYQTADGYAYRLKASNGEILVVSETYTTKDGVNKAIDAVKRNVETGTIKVFADKRGRYKFKLISGNYRVLALSSNYTTEATANRASESFKRFALSADIVEVELDDKEFNEASPITIDAEEKQGGKYTIEKFNGEFSWDLKASNGQILVQSDGYTTKNGCLTSIESFKKNIETGTFKTVKDKHDHFVFKLYSSAGRVCAIGESYTSKSSAESAANSAVAFYKNAEIVEQDDDKEDK